MIAKNDKSLSCTNCKQEIPKGEKECPNCETTVKKPIYKKWWFWVLLIFSPAILTSIFQGGASRTIEEVESDATIAIDQESQIHYLEDKNIHLKYNFYRTGSPYITGTVSNLPEGFTGIINAECENDGCEARSGVVEDGTFSIRLSSVKEGETTIILELTGSNNNGYQRIKPISETFTIIIKSESELFAEAVQQEKEREKKANNPSPTVFIDGVFVIGQDIEPGIYKTNTSREGCYWARHSNTSISLKSILENNRILADSDTPITVNIRNTDKAFESKDCGRWEKQ